jgi:hypothetical protein
MHQVGWKPQHRELEENVAKLLICPFLRGAGLARSAFGRLDEQALHGRNAISILHSSAQELWAQTIFLYGVGVRCVR